MVSRGSCRTMLALHLPAVSVPAALQLPKKGSADDVQPPPDQYSLFSPRVPVLIPRICSSSRCSAVDVEAMVCGQRPHRRRPAAPHPIAWICPSPIRDS
jgi:hypothetical protein